MEHQEEHFEKAVELLGENWLNEQDSKYSVDSDEKDPIKIDQPPKVISQYRIAKEDLNEDSNPIFSKKGLREDAVKFLWIGHIFGLVEDLSVISPSGAICEDVSPKDLFQESLHNEDQFENTLYELEVAASYVERGHEPAFVDETLSTKKSPDLELLDFDERIQIECKRCGIQSSEEETLSNIRNKLCSKIKNSVQSDRYIAVVRLSRTPTGEEVDSISNFLPNSLRISSISQKEIDLPFGTLYLFPFFNQGIIEQPIGGLEGAEVLTEFYDVNVRPVLSAKLGKDKDWDELNHWVLYSESQEVGSIARHKNPVWIGVLGSSEMSESSERIRNQFEGVSGKFDENPAILNIKIPDYREGNALQDLRLRKQAAGELKQRPEISMVVINGFEIVEAKEKMGVQTPETVIPNYDPNHFPPEDLNLLQGSFEDVIEYDEVVSGANEEYMSEEEGIKKLLDDQEGTITFRFTPQESTDVSEAKNIVQEESISGKNSISLKITPDQTFRFTRETTRGKWICEVNCEDIPEFTSIFFCLTWSENESQLSVSTESWEDMRTDVCDVPE